MRKTGWLCLLVLLLSACHAGRFVVYNVPDLRDYPDFFAEGILGQFVYVYPETDFIVVRLGKRAGRTHWARLAQHLAELNGVSQHPSSRTP